MKANEALEAMWRSLDDAVAVFEQGVKCLSTAVARRNPDSAGEYAKAVLRDAIEIYARLGVIGALEEIE